MGSGWPGVSPNEYMWRITDLLPGVVESHPRVVESHPRVVELQPGMVESHPGVTLEEGRLL